MLKNSKGCVRAPVDFDVFYGVERIVLKDVVFNLWDGILFNRAECKLWRRTTTDFGAMIKRSAARFRDFSAIPLMHPVP